MRIMMMLAACGGGSLKTFTFTTSQNVVIPAGVAVLATASGFGARGENASSYLVEQYRERIVLHQYRRSDGGDDPFVFSDTTSPGTAPSASSCNPPEFYEGTAYSHSQLCFEYSDASYYEDSSATTGAAATGFGRTFPGSTGNVQPGVTSFSNVAVTPGTYAVSIPTGGSITISYYE